MHAKLNLNIRYISCFARLWNIFDMAACWLLSGCYANFTLMSLEDSGYVHDDVNESVGEKSNLLIGSSVVRVQGLVFAMQPIRTLRMRASQ